MLLEKGKDGIYHCGRWDEWEKGELVEFNFFEREGKEYDD